MKPEEILTEFSRHHNFNVPPYLHDDKQAILWLLQTKRSVDTAVASHADQLVAQGDASWAMLRSMLDRVYEHSAACLVAYFTGGWASLEALVRVTIEAAVTVIYVTRSDRDLRLGQYLNHYFQTARDKIERSDTSVRLEALTQLEWREEIIRQVANHEGIPIDATGWPTNVFDRFKAVGMETEYRHIYTVLSSQIHSDADSLIDLVVSRCFSVHEPRVAEINANELRYWIRFYIYSGLRYYVMAAHSYAVAFEFVGGIAEIKAVEENVVSFLNETSNEFTLTREENQALLADLLKPNRDE